MKNTVKYRVPQLEEFVEGFKYQECTTSIGFAVFNIDTKEFENKSESTKVWDNMIYKEGPQDIWSNQKSKEQLLKMIWNKQIRVLSNGI